MKQLIFLLASAAMVSAQSTPIVRGRLHTDLDGSQRSITNLFRPTTNLMVVGMRYDGKEGAGTYADPFDGSTMLKFDKLMSNAPPYTLIDWLPTGTNAFLTAGTYGWRAKTGQVIRGGGVGSTVLRLVGATDRWAIDAQQGVTNLTVQDLTIDCDFIGNAVTRGALGVW